MITAEAHTRGGAAQLANAYAQAYIAPPPAQLHRAREAAIATAKAPDRADRSARRPPASQRLQEGARRSNSTRQHAADRGARRQAQPARNRPRDPSGVQQIGVARPAKAELRRPAAQKERDLRLRDRRAARLLRRLRAQPLRPPPALAGRHRSGLRPADPHGAAAVRTPIVRREGEAPALEVAAASRCGGCTRTLQLGASQPRRGAAPPLDPVPERRRRRREVDAWSPASRSCSATPASARGCRGRLPAARPGDACSSVQPRPARAARGRAGRHAALRAACRAARRRRPEAPARPGGRRRRRSPTADRAAAARCRCCGGATWRTRRRCSRARDGASCSRSLADDSDYVLVDAPPPLEVSDAMPLLGAGRRDHHRRARRAHPRHLRAAADAAARAHPQRAGARGRRQRRPREETSRSTASRPDSADGGRRCGLGHERRPPHRWPAPGGVAHRSVGRRRRQDLLLRICTGADRRWRWRWRWRSPCPSRTRARARRWSSARSGSSTLLVNPRLEVTVAVLAVYLGLLDGPVKASAAEATPRRCVRNVLIIAVVLGALMRLVASKASRQAAAAVGLGVRVRRVRAGRGASTRTRSGSSRSSAASASSSSGCRSSSSATC